MPIFGYTDTLVEFVPYGNVSFIITVVEKFENYFGYLARCEGKFGTTTLKISKIASKSKKNTGKMPSKFKNRPLKTLCRNLKFVTAQFF